MIQALLRRVHSFFYSDDEIIKLADGLNEFDAGSYEELLRNNGVIAMRKNMEALYDRYWRPMLFNNFALYVKQSDMERAIEILGSLLGDGKARRGRGRGAPSTSPATPEAESIARLSPASPFAIFASVPVRS